MPQHDYAIIMAGGGGTRLWPVSRKNRPKHLLPLLDEQTLLQITVGRLVQLFPANRILVVTVRDQVHEIQRQLPDIPAENYLIEPMPRGTASVIGLAAAVLRKRDPQALMVVLPSDHFIQNADLFCATLLTAFEVARQDYLVTLGIAPVSAATGYGYIEQGEPVNGDFKFPVYHVRRFTEKPDLPTAQGFLHSKNHLWNGGIFVWRVNAILQEIQRQMPDLHEVIESVANVWGKPLGEGVLELAWQGLKSETIDYGVMEHAHRVAVVLASGFGWTDLGSWDALFEVLLPDKNGNVSTTSNALALGTHRTLVYGTNHERLIVTIGLEDTVIVDTGDVLLVCKSDQTQEVREVVRMLAANHQEKYL